MRIQLVFTFFITALFAQAQSSPLHTLDEMIAQSTPGSPDSAAENTVTFLLNHAQSTTLHDLDSATMESALVHEQSNFLSGNQPGIREIAIVQACNNWSTTLGLTTFVEPSAAALHSYRIAMSEIYPHLFPRGSNGQVTYTVSPLEALYLVDTCLSEGHIPHVIRGNQTTSQNDLIAAAKQYASTLEKYESSTPLNQQNLHTLEILKIAGLN